VITYNIFLTIEKVTLKLVWFGLIRNKQNTIRRAKHGQSQRKRRKKGLKAIHASEDREKRPMRRPGPLLRS
jgi:hypothetical protein